MSQKIGQFLIHNVHGLGVVESLEEQQIGGRTTSFAVMSFGKMRVLVNRDRSAGILRSPITRGETEEILEYLAQPLQAPTTYTNPGVLHRSHVQGLRSGDLFQVCDVVRDLAARSRSRKLAPRDAETMSGARTRLIRELAHVREETEDGVERQLDAQLALG